MKLYDSGTSFPVPRTRRVAVQVLVCSFLLVRTFVNNYIRCVCDLCVCVCVCLCVCTYIYLNGGGGGGSSISSSSSSSSMDR